MRIWRRLALGNGLVCPSPEWRFACCVLGGAEKCPDSRYHIYLVITREKLSENSASRAGGSGASPPKAGCDGRSGGSETRPYGRAGGGCKTLGGARDTGRRDGSICDVVVQKPHPSRSSGRMGHPEIQRRTKRVARRQSGRSALPGWRRAATLLQGRRGRV